MKSATSSFERPAESYVFGTDSTHYLTLGRLEARTEGGVGEDELVDVCAALADEVQVVVGFARVLAVTSRSMSPADHQKPNWPSA